MRRLALLLLFAWPCLAQTNVGGFQVPTTWTSTPMSGNDIVNGNMETCSGGPCTGAGQTLGTWTSTACTIASDTVVAGGHVHTGTYSMHVSGCGSSSQNGLVQQTFTYQGLGGSIEVCYYMYTDASFTAPAGMDGPYKAFGTDLSDTYGRLSGQTNTNASVIPPNSQGWFRVCRETIIRQFDYTGDAITFQMRFPIPGMTGNAWIDDVTVTENDTPIRNFVTSAVDGSKGYWWADLKPGNNNCSNGTSAVAGELCGVLELSTPAGSSGLTYLMKLGTASGCVSGSVKLSGTTGTGNTVAAWSFDPLLAIQSSPTTPYYLCAQATDNTTSIVYQYQDYVFYPLGATFRATLNNWLDVDQAHVWLGNRRFTYGYYDSCTSANCQGSSGGGPFSLSAPGGAGNPVTSYLQYQAGQGFAAPQSLSSATHSGSQIKVNGPYRTVDVASNFFNERLNFVDATTESPIAGSGDQLGPDIQNLFNYGIQHTQITLPYFGTGWDEAASVTSATIPPTPSVPVQGFTGFIDGLILGSTNYAWFEECPVYWGSNGQAGDLPELGACSLPVRSAATIGFGTNISFALTMEACHTERQQGWMVAAALGTSTTTSPSGDQFFPILDANTTANEGWIDCSNRGGPSTLTIVGSPGDGNSLGQASWIAPANDPTPPTFTSSACTANCGVPSSTHGGATVGLQIQAAETCTVSGGICSPGVMTEPSLPSVDLYSSGGLGSSTGTTLFTANAGTANQICTGTGTEAAFVGETAVINSVSYTISSVSCSPNIPTPSTMTLGTTVPSGTNLVWSIQPTVVMPTFTGSQTGLYLSLAQQSGTAQNNPWKFFMQQNPGSPLGSGASYVVPTQGLAATNVIAPSDLTNVGRISWFLGLTDAQINADFANLAAGSDVANFPNSGQDFFGNYSCDECGPAHAWAGSFRQNKSAIGWLPIAPGIITTSLSTTPGDYKFHRDSIDGQRQDPYCCGRLATSDLYVNGGQCRNDYQYTGQNNAAPVLNLGCSSGATQLTPQLSDIAAFGCLFGSYASRPCVMVLQSFAAVSTQRGFVYGTYRRACWKEIIDVKAFGSQGFGCQWWDWGNGSGMDYFWYIEGNTNAYGELLKLSAQTKEPQLSRTLLTPTLDGSAPTAVAGINSPNIGQIITAVSFTVGVQLACTPSGTLTANSYANVTRYPYAPLTFFTGQDPITKDILFGFNNMCGSVNSGSPTPTGGAPNVAVITLNSAAIPTGATQIEWVGASDLNGNSFAVIGSNANCPAATVGANQFCVVMNDQEADFGWLRVPREKMHQGNVILAGQVH